MKKIILVLALFSVVFAQAQEEKQKRKMTVSLAYPVVVLDYDTSYKGVTTINYSYFFKRKGKNNCGLTFEWDYFVNDGRIDKYKNERFYYHHFNFFREFRLGETQKIALTPNLGYTFLASDYYRVRNVNTSAEVADTFRTKGKGHGFNLGLDASYEINSKFFGKVAYRYMTIIRNSEKLEGLTDTIGFEDANLFSIGFGYTF